MSSVLVVGLIVLTGCGRSRDDGRRQPVPVTGIVRHQGKPVEGAAVTFRPAPGAPAAVGETDSEGRYTLMTFEPGDGAVPGNYGVQVVKYEAFDVNKQHGKTPDLKNLLPEKYARQTTSGLQYSVNADQENVYDIDLQ